MNFFSSFRVIFKKILFEKKETMVIPQAQTTLDLDKNKKNYM